MSVLRDHRDGRWRYRKTITLPGGKIVRISGTPAVSTKIAAEIAEREHILRVQTPSSEAAQKKEVPKFAAFAEEFMSSYAAANNKPSEQTSKRSILLHHLVPPFGSMNLDHITVQDVERLKARMLGKELSRKRVNNVLNVLSKILKYALEMEIIEKHPAIKMLKVAPRKFDFFTYEDIDIKARVLAVMRSNWRGHIGSPKGGRERKIPLTTRGLASLKSIRHLRGPLVFCWDDGKRWTFSTMRAGMKRQCKRAGLRVTGWHVLRHTFCSHLAMQGAAPRAIQELAGHASIGVTQRYMHLAPSALTEAIALLENRIALTTG